MALTKNEKLIGLGVLFAAVVGWAAWPKTASAAPSGGGGGSNPTPGGGTPPAPNPGAPLPPPGDLPVNPPAASKVKPTTQPPSVDLASIPDPTGSPFGAIAYVWEYSVTGWRQLSIVPLDASHAYNPLDVSTYFAQISAYKLFPPPYQCVQIYVWTASTGWQPAPFGAVTCNY